MEDVALRRELEEKKKLEGKWVEPKMTPKQKEAFAIQLDKEKLIRQRIQKIKTDLNPPLELLNSALKGQPKAFQSIVSNGSFLPLGIKMVFQTNSNFLN
jgi:hypothetical protein